MSIVHSNSMDSSSSIATMTTIPSTDHPNNSANQLYEDRTHFQAIFSNDSRFFDTSLHLFKSYSALGYIPSNEDKTHKHHIPFLTAPTHGHRHRWKARLLGVNQENEHQNGTIKALLTPTLLKKPEPFIRNLSDSKMSTDHQRNSPMTVHYQKVSLPSVTLTDDSDPDIVITRL